MTPAHQVAIMNLLLLPSRKKNFFFFLSFHAPGRTPAELWPQLCALLSLCRRRRSPIQRTDVNVQQRLARRSARPAAPY